jgi:hypothetical protein
MNHILYLFHVLNINNILICIFSQILESLTSRIIFFYTKIVSTTSITDCTLVRLEEAQEGPRSHPQTTAQIYPKLLKR